jgi:hypothetical protein
MPEHLIMKDAEGGTAVLTTDTPASHYGIPMLVIDATDVRGEFGPADRLHPNISLTAAQVVLAWGLAPERTPTEKEAARRYLHQWPEGPQLDSVTARHGTPRTSV